MKRFLIIIVLGLSCATGFAQSEEKGLTWEDVEPWNVVDPEPVEPDGHNRQWYEDQACAWQKVVMDDPKNENAWRNLFRASYFNEAYSWYKDYYAYVLKVSEPPLAKTPMTNDVLRKMKAAIPDSNAFYLCACQLWLPEWGEFDTNILIKAIENAPQDISDQELRTLILRLWKIYPESTYLEDFFRKLYEKGYYSDRIMRYGWNLIQSMPKDAIYIAGDWYQYEQILLMQYLWNERKDILVISYGDIFSDENYRKDICKRLKLKPFKPQNYKYDTNRFVASEFIEYLKYRCDRPFYLSMDLVGTTELNEDSLYNEGLLIKYSEKRYDNVLVALHNVKEVYDLDYLVQPMFVFDPYLSSKYADNNVVYSLWKLTTLFDRHGYKEATKQLLEFLKKTYNQGLGGNYYSNYYFFHIDNIKRKEKLSEISR